MTSATAISTTARALLTAAAEAADRIVILPERLPVAARRAVVQSMLKAGLIEETLANDGDPAWRRTESGDWIALRATAAGLAAVGTGDGDGSAATPAPQDDEGQEHPPAVQPSAVDVAVPSTPQSPRVRLRAAAEAVLVACDDAGDVRPALAAALEALRGALTATGTRSGSAGHGTPRLPRIGTKREAVLALLGRPEGAIIAQVADATGWAQHTVRGFFAGLKKKGITVDVLERVRQVGPGKEGAKGSFTVYHVAEAG